MATSAPQFRSTVVIKRWYNLDKTEYTSGWAFYLPWESRVAGYVPDRFFYTGVWDPSLFIIDPAEKTITLRANARFAHLSWHESNDSRPADTTATIEEKVQFMQECNAKLLHFCRQNVNQMYFRDSFGPFFRDYDGPSRRRACFHPILSRRYLAIKPALGGEHFVGIQVPSPARGILGILTSGCHMTLFTIDAQKRVDKIWVSKRGRDKEAYPGCYDQVVAGGMDTEDNRDSWVTLRREAKEEADIGITRTGEWWGDATRGGRKIGRVEFKNSIYFLSRKGLDAGSSEQDHIEAGTRFCFELQIERQEVPTPNERDIEKFEALTPQQVKKSLMLGQWKPNSGLVMVQFLKDHDLLDAASQASSELRKLRQREIGVDFPEFIS